MDALCDKGSLHEMLYEWAFQMCNLSICLTWSHLKAFTATVVFCWRWGCIMICSCGVL